MEETMMEDAMVDESATLVDGDVVVLETNKGVIKIQMDREHAPISVENFVNYVNDGFYDGLIFHRVIRDFMIQGGGFTPDTQHKQGGDPIKNEASNGLLNVRGSIAMARTSQPDSATSQFFINLIDNPFLDYPNNGGYAVFGNVIEGMEVVDEIGLVLTETKNGHRDWPKVDIVIEKAYIAK